MKAGRKSDDNEKGNSADKSIRFEFPQSNCCYAHDWVYFTEPVHPYDYSDDWNLEDEWNRKMRSTNAGK